MSLNPPSDENNGFPCTDEEWSVIKEACLRIINATLMGNEVLHAWNLAGLSELLAELRVRRGEHPLFLETEADFLGEDDKRIDLYQRAIRMADERELQTLSIRLSFAKLLLNRGEITQARQELLACKWELDDADNADRLEWNEIFDSMTPEAGS